MRTAWFVEALGGSGLVTSFSCGINHVQPQDFCGRPQQQVSSFWRWGSTCEVVFQGFLESGSWSIIVTWLLPLYFSCLTQGWSLCLVPTTLESCTRLQS